MVVKLMVITNGFTAAECGWILSGWELVNCGQKSVTNHVDNENTILAGGLFGHLSHWVIAYDVWSFCANVIRNEEPQTSGGVQSYRGIQSYHSKHSDFSGN